MRMYVALFVGFFLFPLWVQAQDQVIKNYSPDDFEQLIKGDLKIPFLKSKIVDDKGIPAGFKYTFKEFYFGEFNERGKFLLLRFTWPLAIFNNQVTLEKVNEWNDKVAVYGRVFIRRGVVVAEGTMSFRAGITANQLKDFLTGYLVEAAAFPPYVGGLMKNN